MQSEIDNLSFALNLTPYQTRTLRTGINNDKYDVSRLVKRDGLLFIPLKQSGFWERITCIFIGRRTDVIGKTKMITSGNHRMRL